VVGYVIFAIGALFGGAMLALWLHRHLAARRSRGGRRWWRETPPFGTRTWPPSA